MKFDFPNTWSGVNSPEQADTLSVSGTGIGFNANCTWFFWADLFNPGPYMHNFYDIGITFSVYFDMLQSSGRFEDVKFASGDKFNTLSWAFSIGAVYNIIDEKYFCVPLRACFIYGESQIEDSTDLFDFEYKLQSGGIELSAGIKWSPNVELNFGGNVRQEKTNFISYFATFAFSYMVGGTTTHFSYNTKKHKNIQAPGNVDTIALSLFVGVGIQIPK
ncbi:MAG: hypothetical protein LBV52_02405 [Spirochaetaceae bacterium]|nr:hypothetical protein [Spirochaetaceae bacterium]